MRFHFLKAGTLLIVLFCAASVFSQESEWIAGEKADNIEVFYRIEKSGSNTYDVEVKIVNQRTKPIDIIVKFEQKTANQGNSKTVIERATADLLRSDKSKYLKLSVKAKETSVSEIVEIEGSALETIKIACWSNTTAQKKCDLESFKPKSTIQITPP